MTNAETNTDANVAAQGGTVAPEAASWKKGATRKKDAPKGRKNPKGGKTKAAPAKAAKAVTKAAKPAKEASAPRTESKGAKILAMIARPKGATLSEIMRATEWQAHSVRGFISIAGKKHGITIESSKNEAGVRLYRSTN